MVPTDDQIRLAAYHRWQRRGHGHGQHDADWIAAEQDLLLALNYRIQTYPTDPTQTSPTPHHVDRLVCRFCEQAAPRTRFAPPGSTLSATHPIPGPLAADICELCDARFQSTLAPALQHFVAAVRARTLPEAVSTPAYKGLVHAALTMLPITLLDLFPDALDWVSHSDNDPLDPEIAHRGILVHTLERRQPPWSAIAVKSDPEAPMPHVLSFLGTETATIELPLPMCLRDEDHDGEPLAEPEVPTVDGLNRYPGPHSTRRLHLARDPTPRRGRLLLPDLP